jgi:hypothetical protein
MSELERAAMEEALARKYGGQGVRPRRGDDRERER